jgi:cell division protein FtsB
VVVAATEPSATWALTSAIVAGLLTLTSGLLTAWFAFRGTTRTTDAQREAAFDAAVDADRAALRAERDELARQLRSATTERDDYRERWARLRLDVIATGLDPDRLPRQRTKHG